MSIGGFSVEVAWRSWWTITLPLRQKPFQGSGFWRRYCWDNLINIVVHPWAGVRSDQTWTRWGRRKPWILVGVPLTVTGLLALPLAPTLAGVVLAILVTNVGRALFVPPMVAWLGDL